MLYDTQGGLARYDPALVDETGAEAERPPTATATVAALASRYPSIRVRTGAERRTLQVAPPPPLHRVTGAGAEVS